MYLFLFGRDSKLSKLEISIYFYANNVKYDVIVEDDRYIIIDTKTKINLSALTKKLAGITRVVDIYSSSSEIDTLFLDKIDVIKNKINFSISSISLEKKDLEYIENLTKDYLKKEKIKAVLKKPKKHSAKEKNYIVNPNNYFSWKLYDGFELFVVYANNKYYFGKTISCFNPKENIFKDKNLPKRKNLYSTSFRLADIMINFLGFSKNKTIVDPFCGTGTFLVEGLLKGYDVVGVDKDKQMCKNSVENGRWVVSKYQLNKRKYQIVCGDSSKINFQADYAVFEPYMGPFLRKLPSEKKSRKIAKELESIYFNVFKNLSKNLSKTAKIVCVLPEIPIYNGSIKISNNVFYKNGFVLEVVSKYSSLGTINPIPYKTPDGSRIVRKIYLLKRR